MIGIRAKKALGQHFLHDKNTAQRIVESLSGTTATVLEIGPGVGALTAFLLRRPDITTYAVEIDTESAAYLQQTFPALQERLIVGDFLLMPLSDYFSGMFAVIGNLPYHISSQIFFKILACRGQIPEVVCMIQKEVAERIAGGAGSKTYGILSVLLQAYYDIEYLFTVHEHVFTPPPKVKSAVIRLRRNAVEQLPCDERLFVKVVKATFNQRRKVIRNSIKLLTGDAPLPCHRYFTMRPEQLRVDEFVELTRMISNVI
ncbi:MAG: 16S rRNA (adenine(1518)-N(6)/adenine(1519)-N(6))-dimethyltransferase RsmA [Prevotellaceae bacterium]|jgi:16S rRNA (adenine1518-N6/adenine1519-N6)-dimethyltransferase|nr:16S rRNA (adenine(1518)-N(6)/adenine(1519)-N(6))-dimethyltransferase RsmA [Prevotellaceae bacterium]